MSLTKIGSIGINTGIQFAGVTTVSTLHVGSGVTLSSDGDIFATGISTFSEDIKVGSGVTISPDGDVFFTGVGTGNGSGLTALNASNLGSGTVPTARLGSGTASSSTFLRGDSTFQTVNTDLVGDTSPQLGGNLDVNTKNIVFGDSGSASDDRLTFGAGTDLSIYHGGDQNYVSVTGTGNLNLTSGGAVVTKVNSSEDAIVCNANSSVDLYHNNTKKFETASYGVLSAGQVRVSASNASTVAFSVGDEGTGFYNTGSNAIGYASQGTQKWNIDSSGNLRLNDSVSAQFGHGSDLLIYHDGNSKIQNSNNSCDFRIQSNSIELKANSVDEYMLKGSVNGAVELYYDNSKKIETASDGVNLAGTNLIFQGSSNRMIKYRSGDNDMIYEFDAGDFMRQDIGNSRHEFFVGNYKQASVTGDGITFGSDTAAANALNKYEKGTFTPRFHGQGNNNTITTSTNVGEYVRIGRLVHVKLYVVFSNRNGANSVLAMDGLPFSNAGNYTAVPYGRWTGMQNCPVLGALVGYIGDGSAEITFNEVLTSGVGASDVNRVTDTTSVMLNFCYPIWSA